MNNEDRCRIPDDWLDNRRHSFFMARAVLRRLMPQSALRSKTPFAAMKDGGDDKPQLFNKKPAPTGEKSAANRPGCDTKWAAQDW
jgi:hypothetical protein